MIDCVHSCCDGKLGVAHDRKWRRSASLIDVPAMQTTKTFTGDVRCKNNDRLGSMHTSDTRRSVGHKIQ